MIKQYRKKPVVISALQYDGTNVDEVKEFLGSDFGGHVDGWVYVSTLEGELTASPNDFIVRGVNGEHYPVKPDIFEQTYEGAPKATTDVGPDVPVRWTDEHGPDELYDKFTVIRNSTGEPVTSWSFVLLPEYDEEACYALLTYAAYVSQRAPTLAAQLQERVFTIMEENLKERHRA